MHTCEYTDSTFLTTTLKIIGLQCQSTAIYAIVLVFYMFMIAGKHKLITNTKQIHREALGKLPRFRNICKIAAYSIADTLIHIIYVLFVTSNNIGFLIASLVAHVVGIVIVYRTQRPDHKHPIHALARALRNIENADLQTKEDWILIKNTINTPKILKYIQDK